MQYHEALSFPLLEVSGITSLLTLDSFTHLASVVIVFFISASVMSSLKPHVTFIFGRLVYDKSFFHKIQFFQAVLRQ